MRETVYLGLGSNLGDREGTLRRALAALQQPDFTIQRLSSVYETEPQEVKEQPDFYNIVLEAEAAIYPVRLLLRIAEIERNLGGRRRPVPKGPRTIDIDILLFGRCVLDTPELTIPHPRMMERRFVLEPLLELAPELRHPVTGQPLAEALAAAADQFVRRTPIRLALSLG